MTLQLAAYKYYCDWDNDGDFSGPSEDISAFVLSASWELFGLDESGAGSKSGMARLVIDNSSSIFSSYNVASPLYGLLLPNTLFLITMIIGTGAPVIMFQGYIENISPVVGAVVGVSTAELLAHGPLYRITDAEAHLAMQSDIDTGTAADLVLDSMGWPAGLRSIETGLTTMSRFWAPRKSKGFATLRQLEAAECGRLGESKDGKIVLENRAHRLSAPHNAAQAHFGTGVLNLWNLQQEDALKGIYKVIEANVRTFNLSESIVLATVSDVRAQKGGTPPKVPAGGTLKLTIEYPSADGSSSYPAVDSWGTVDYEANSLANAGGDDVTGNVTATREEFADRLELEFTNAGSVDAHLILLRAHGVAIKEEPPIPVDAKDTPDALARYGRLLLPNPSQWLTGLDEGQDYCAHELAMRKDPRPRLSFELRANYDGNHLAEAQACDISRRYHIQALDEFGLYLDEDFFVESMHHEVDSFRLHKVQIQVAAVRSHVWPASAAPYTPKVIPEPDGALPTDSVEPNAPALGVAKKGVFTVLIGAEKPSGYPAGWNNVTKIELQVASDAAFSTVVYSGNYSGTILTGCQFTFATDAPGHFWARTRAINGHGTGDYSDAIQFDADASRGDTDVPSAPILTLKNVADEATVGELSIRARVDFQNCSNKAGLFMAWVQLHTANTFTEPESDPVYSPGTRKAAIVNGKHILTDAGATFLSAGLTTEHIIVLSYNDPWPGSPATRAFIAPIKSIDSDTQIPIGGTWSQPTGDYTYRICNPYWALDSGAGFCRSVNIYDQGTVEKGYVEVDIPVPVGANYYGRAWVSNLLGRSPASAVTAAKQSAVIPVARLHPDAQSAIIRATQGFTETGMLLQGVPESRLPASVSQKNRNDMRAKTGAYGRQINDALYDTDAENKKYLWSGNNAWTHSEDLTDASYNKPTLTVTANAATDPDGNVTANKVTETLDTAQWHYVLRTFTSMTTNVMQSFSCHAKMGTRRYLRIDCVDKAYGSAIVSIVDLQTGVITYHGGTGKITVDPKDSGWFRIKCAFNSGTGAGSGYAYLQFVNDAMQSQYDGDGSSYLYLWGFQFEPDVPSASAYNPTTTAAQRAWIDAQDGGAARAIVGLDIGGSIKNDIPAERKVVGRPEPISTTLGRINASGQLINFDDIAADGPTYGRPTLAQRNALVPYAAGTVPAGTFGSPTYEVRYLTRHLMTYVGPGDDKVGYGFWRTLGNTVYLETSGTLPGGLNTGVLYYVRDSGFQYRLSTANDDAHIVNITDIGTGSHFIRLASPPDSPVFVQDSQTCSVDIYWNYTAAAGYARPSKFKVFISDGNASYPKEARVSLSNGVHKFTIDRACLGKTLTISIQEEYTAATGLVLGTPYSWGTVTPTMNAGAPAVTSFPAGEVDWAGGAVWFGTQQYLNDTPPTYGYSATPGTDNGIRLLNGMYHLTLTGIAYSPGPNLATHIAIFVKPASGTILLSSDSVVGLINLASVPSSYTIPFPFAPGVTYTIGIAVFARTKNGDTFNTSFRQIEVGGFNQCTIDLSTAGSDLFLQEISSNGFPNNPTLNTYPNIFVWINTGNVPVISGKYLAIKYNGHFYAVKVDQICHYL